MRRARAPEGSVRVFEDSRHLSLAVGRRFVGAAAAAVRERGRFSVALSGGRTPLELYRVLATELPDFVAWRWVHFFWSDERYLLPTDAESNVHLAREALLDALAIPPENVHPPRTDLPDPDQAALDYELEIVSFFEPALPVFDWIFLGLGKDGHVASLFPGSKALEERQRLVLAVEDAPDPWAVRLTMTPPLIDRAREIHFLVTGEDKKEAVERALAPEGGDSPARRIRPTEGSVLWWLDRGAAGDVREEPQRRGGPRARRAMTEK